MTSWSPTSSAESPVGLILEPEAYLPRALPEAASLGIAVVGFGQVARKWHMTAYKKYGLKVVGVFDTSDDAAAVAESEWGLETFHSLDALLSDPRVAVVDVATRHAQRIEIVRAAIAAGKHVLAQKPLTTDLAAAERLVGEAAAGSVRVAVNQNGRWAPPWRASSVMLERGMIGDPLAVTHVYDTRMSWTPDLERHGSDHFLIFDYSIHWIDASIQWIPKRLLTVQARDSVPERDPGPGAVSQNAWIALEFEGGLTAVLRGVTSGRSHAGHPFWIHGSRGTIRGSVDDSSGDYVELETAGQTSRLKLQGNWFPDGFGGSMCELLNSVILRCEPSNSLARCLPALRATLAACRSADEAGVPVAM